MVDVLLPRDGLLGCRGLLGDVSALPRTVLARFGEFLGGLFGLRVGDRARGVRLLPVLGLALLQLPLAGQRVVTGHRTGHLFRLPLDRVQQALTGLSCFVFRVHPVLLPMLRVSGRTAGRPRVGPLCVGGFLS